MRELELKSWQTAFVGKYLTDQPQMATLISKVGMGKSMAALKLIELLTLNWNLKTLVILTPAVILKDQWWYMLKDRLDSSVIAHLQIFNENIHQLRNNEKLSQLRKMLLLDTFVLIDESHALKNDKILQTLLNNDFNSSDHCKVLFLATSGQDISGRDTMDVTTNNYHFGTEYIYDDSVLTQKKTRIKIARFSPSYDILQKVLKQGVKFDGLGWREFEKLVSQLLEADGYEIELMQGTKDGGVDVIALKNDGIVGFYKTIWQAKKYAKNKVGLSTIRELADSVHELKASKGILVTSTFLTKGALQRVERDRFTLSKVDKKDLEGWINKLLLK